eukprot:TRINITY_DN66392_c8_g1_i1.p1 TRINITY_DN66392_c8_g1~~TRINITY_DN66392_c8_g1_i1.p1  ORF type:complete len:326 (+),score=28.05 TRINITY_DN66392_c8_g1_i1:27-980(+)
MKRSASSGVSSERNVSLTKKQKIKLEDVKTETYTGSTVAIKQEDAEIFMAPVDPFWPKSELIIKAEPTTTMVTPSTLVVPASASPPPTSSDVSQPSLVSASQQQLNNNGNAQQPQQQVAQQPQPDWATVWAKASNIAKTNNVSSTGISLVQRALEEGELDSFIWQLQCACLPIHLGTTLQTKLDSCSPAERRKLRQDFLVPLVKEIYKQSPPAAVLLSFAKNVTQHTQSAPCTVYQVFQRNRPPRGDDLNCVMQYCATFYGKFQTACDMSLKAWITKNNLAGCAPGGSGAPTQTSRPSASCVHMRQKKTRRKKAGKA